MQYLKISSADKIPILGLGTWEVGGRLTGDRKNDRKNIKAIKSAIEMGYEHIDTAEMYGGGHTEKLVGEAIKEFDRDDLFITSKVKPGNLRYDNLLNSAKNSLERLATDYLDLYLIHKPNFSIPISETMEAMDELINQGLTRYIGVSNFSVEQLKKAQEVSENSIVTNQIEYNLLTQHRGEYNKNIRKTLIPYCQKNDIIVTAFRPLAKSRLATNKYDILNKMAEKYSKTPAQIALNWVISQEKVITIPKATTEKHLKENLGAVGWSLEPDDHERLTNSFDG